MYTRPFPALYLLAVFCLAGCSRDPLEYPKGLQHEQLPVFQCSIDSVFQTKILLDCQFTEVGNRNILDYGLLWDSVANSQSLANSKPFGPNPAPQLNVLITGLLANKRYYLRPYVVLNTLDTLFFEAQPVQTLPTWEALAPYPAGAISGTGLFRIGDTLYSVAGFPNHTGFYSLDLITNTWTYRGIYTGAGKNALAAFTIDSIGYVGLGTNTAVAPVKNFYAYNPQTQKFTAIAPFGGTAREAVVAFAIDGIGYVGLGNTSNEVKLSDFWKYDPQTNKWTKLPYDFPGGPRTHPTAFVIGSKAYIGYGRDYDDGWYEFDPSKPNPWKALRSDPPVRYAGFGFSIGNKGYFGGGGNNDFWEFDPAGNADGLGAWRELDPMPAAISFTQARTYKNSAIVVGGRDGTFGFTDKVWKFNLEL